MRHARDEDLVPLADVLTSLRATESLTETRPGIFYRRSKAFLHFHAHDDDLYADVRTDEREGFVRVRVTTKAEQRRLLSSVRRSLARGEPPRS